MGFLILFSVLIALLRVTSKVYAFDIRSEGLFMKCETSSSNNHTVREIVHTVANCNNKIRLTLTIKNEGKSPEDLKYTFIKDVLDIESGNRLRLLNPLLVSFRQEQVILGYPIKYLTAVNGRASETVINYENQKNFTGCDDESIVNPTCGLQHQKGISVEHSQGFCCFCPNVATNGKQGRGGQDCSLSKSPLPGIDLAAYKASAHCLKKDQLWFTVNALDEPSILQQVFIQVFNLRHLLNGSSVWVALSGNEDFTVGPHNPFQYDDNKTIVVTYATAKPSESSITIPYQKSRLLIPQPLLDVPEEDLPPASKNGPGDYILISKDVIHSEGDICDKAGVSYEGFSFQTDRCDSPKNSCLKNQPLDFWEKDSKLIKSGGKGSYLLKNFGTPYKDPIIINKETKEHWLALEYYKSHENIIYIENNADDIVSLTIGKHGIILMVITESTSKFIAFHVNIQNSGLASAEYNVKVTGCQYLVPDSNIQSEVIAPQLNSLFVVKTKAGDMQLNEQFTCTVELSTALYKVIARREVTIKPKGRCICNFHCSCVCLGESLKCEPMSEEDYRLAGFRGSLPILTAKPPYKPWIVKYPVEAVFAFILSLFLIGFAKASIGFVGVSSVGEFGLFDLLYKPKKIERYSDPVLEDAEVLYDENGYPLHPDTKEKLRMFTAQWLFFLNIFFCFVWPVQIFKSQMSQRDSQYKPLQEDAAHDAVTTDPRFSIDEVGSTFTEDAAIIDISGLSETSDVEQEEEEEIDDPNYPSKFKKKVDKLNQII